MLRLLSALLLQCLLFVALLVPYDSADAGNDSRDALTWLTEAAANRLEPDARARLLQWQELINTGARVGKDEERLVIVNRFFNRVPSGLDNDIWGVKDYWATPIEFLVANRGDCEDFAVAKYFTLRQMGVSESRLRITYVTAYIVRKRILQPHMVLAYYADASAEPLILDNIVSEILPSSKRSDLSPVLGFNSSGLWSAKQEKSGVERQGGALPNAWLKMLERLDRQSVRLGATTQ